MLKKIPSQANITKLLAYLPLFDKPERLFVKRWIGGEKSAEGALTILPPDCEDDVKEFFRAASQACWTDTEYEPSKARKMLDDAEAVNNASIENIRTMLTYCVRGERFCEGHWASVLEYGQIVALLRRLAQIQAASSVN